ASRASSMPRRPDGRTVRGGGSATARVIPALLMSGTYPPGALWALCSSAPAWRGPDVVDVAGGAPGPGAVREEVPERVAVDVVAGHLAEEDRKSGVEGTGVR